MATHGELGAKETKLGAMEACTLRKGLDLLGPFPQAPGQVKYLIVGVDYFTKWIKAELLATITAQRSRKFLYKNIITRYEIPHSITTDNGTQFINSTFRNLSATGEIPFRLAYGVEAMIPVEINEQSPRVRFYDAVGNIQAHKEELELLPEVRQQAQIREAALKQRMTNIYNNKVVQRSFTSDNLVLIRNDISVNKSGEGKLAANWKSHIG
ncbi:uncharacterized protein [Arachis hypogaea]|uniref:uncharacterized protein n=1 Tax=Arachis hypogaea TaxID=3818 RepID=UPI003B221A52